MRLSRRRRPLAPFVPCPPLYLSAIADRTNQEENRSMTTRTYTGRGRVRTSPAGYLHSNLQLDRLGSPRGVPSSVFLPKDIQLVDGQRYVISIDVQELPSHTILLVGGPAHDDLVEVDVLHPNHRVPVRNEAQFHSTYSWSLDTAEYVRQGTTTYNGQTVTLYVFDHLNRSPF